MGTLQFKNNAQTTLSGAITNSQTSITVSSSALFPVLTAGDYFYATMFELSGNVEVNIEIIKVTATSGASWTVVRAQDGTVAQTRNIGTTCYIELRYTAASAQQMLQKDNNLSDLASASTARTNLGLGSIATQASSNVNITGGTISGVTLTSLDSGTTIQDNADTTKQVKFEVSGVTTATTRTLTVPNASGTLALTSDLTAGYQPLDSDLTAVAGLAANGLIARTGSGTAAVRSITQPAAGITVTNGDGVSGNPTLALANDLAAVEGITTTGFVKRTASETWTAASIADADVPSALTGKTYNALTLTANATGFSVAGGTTSKTLTVNKTLTLDGTDGATITFPSGAGTLAFSDQTFYIGTTQVAINRTSGSLTLNGVNIDGTAGSATSATTATKSTNLVGGNNTTLLGAVPYQSGTDTTTLLSPNTTTTRNFLRQTGTGTNGAAPAWDTVTKTDVGLSNVENTALSTWAGSANITTLGTVATGTWDATAIGISKGGTGAATATAAFNALSPSTTLGDVIYHDGTDDVRLAGNTTTTRKFFRQTGTGSVSAAPTWDTLVDGDIPSALTGKTYNGLTLTAAATGFTVAGGTTSKTLTVNNTLTLAGTDSSTLNIGAGGTLGSAAFTASTAYAPAAGSANITTVGTIGSGTWQGSAIGISYGGTGQTSKAAGFNALSPVTTLGDLIYGDGANSNTRLAGNTTTTKQFLTQTGTGSVSAAPTWGALVNGDIPTALSGKTYNGLSLTTNTTGFSVAGGTTSKTLQVDNNLILAGTDGSTLNIGAGGTLGSAAFTASTAYEPAITTLAVTKGGTGNTTIPALSVFAANTLNTLTAVTATAGQSVRVNAGGTAWEAYTPSSGGGDTTLANNNAFTGANTFYNATGQTFAPATANDGILLKGRAGGTSSYRVTVDTATLSASRTLTLPDNTGTVLTTGATVTVAQGGTGATSVSGLVKGNGTSAFTAATAGTDYPGLSTTNTFTANQTISANLGVNSTPGGSASIETGGAATGSKVRGIISYATVYSDITNAFHAYESAAYTQASSFTLTYYRHYAATQGAIGAGSAVTNQYGFFAESNLTGATNNYGFYSNINAGTGRWGFYSFGDAANYFNGATTFAMSVRESKKVVSASDIDTASGNYFTRTISGTTTFTVSNVPTTGTAASFILELTNGGSATVNWWSGMKWAGGTAPTLTAAGVDILGFYTHDGGTTWRGLVLAKDVK